ncbi:MAG TPA: hypothetical protein VGB63_05095 [Pedobacter sp.]|jgi:hypothetical protein
MKKLQTLIVLVTVLMTGLAVNVTAQTTTTISTGIVIDAKGAIHDYHGTKLGYIDKDNIVRNTKGQKIYFIDKSGNVIDANGKKLGKTQKNGNFYSVDGTSILTTKTKGEETCEILDPKGHNLGTTHKNYKLHACAAHCLALKEKNAKN